MRRWNAALSALILVLFLVHAVLGGFQLLGGSRIPQMLTHIMEGLFWIHTGIGIWLTVQTLRAQKAAGAAYFRENRLFWARRVSGLAVMVLLFFHMHAFTATVDGATRLAWFDGAKLAAQLLLVAAVAVHVITNVRPALISFGVPRLKARAGDILFVLAVLLLFMAAAFIVYYLRWNVW